MGNTEDLQETLIKLRERIAGKGDMERVDKLQDLLDKWHRGQADITFCGHFSAGKSSLINRLCGASILPSSPIPTSANIVTIEHGEELVIIERADAAPLQVALADLDEACRDGGEIRRIRLQYPVPFLQGRARLLDTPGVDSTDDQHRKATEDALHMADVVCYVMDYNHVLSEMNFEYIRKLSNYGKPIVLIVNQIDKHREQELSFASFRERVQEALGDWMIQPDALLFVSVKKPDDPNNEWAYLRQLLQQLVAANRTLTVNGIALALRQLILEHEAWCIEQEQNVRQSLSQTSLSDLTVTEEEVRVKERELETLHRAWERLAEPAKLDLQKILDNANVIPAPSRDIAHHYLESKRSGFRVGLLFTERKTQAEQERRLHAWRDEVAAQADAHIRWHVSDYCKQLVDGWAIESKAAEEVASRIDGLQVEVDSAWLASLVTAGGHFDDAYTLTYTKLVAEQLKQRYRKKLWDLLEQLQELIRPHYQAMSNQLENQLQAARTRLNDSQALHQLDRQLEQYIEKLNETLSEWAELPRLSLQDLCQEWFDALSEHRNHSRQTSPVVDEAKVDSVEVALSTPFKRADHEQRSPSSVRSKLLEAASRLKQSHDLLADMPLFAHFARTLLDKAARLDENQYTIALFGAFSAGKSSFANALLHTHLLPVSPNPTTAAINAVIPPTEEYPAGRAKLIYKSRAAMFADLRLSLEKLHIPLPDSDEALPDVIRRAELSKVSAGGKVHVAFLQAVNHGWHRFNQHLDSEQWVDLEAYVQAVADETQACFLESVELYMDSALSEHGMILVDTPGADSINARHTGVAFNYIKNADAILFVTYYNHAFSHADREFLLQLGRVKDSFALNKMFFIVNAADLASSEQEMDEVVEHVRSNLTAFGIREPRIFPISSLEANESYRSGDEARYARSGMQQFEAEFYSFVQNELAEMSIRSGLSEIARSRDALADWIHTMQQARHDAEAQTKMIENGLQQSAEVMRDMRNPRRIEELAQEIEELIYYVAQRVNYRYGELYNLSFNPSTFADQALNEKDKLTTAYAELLHHLTFDLSQELRATTLRIESYMNRSLQRLHGDCSERLSALLPGFAAPDAEPVAWPTPNCEVALSDASDEWKAVRSAYRNNRQFFEQGGKSALKDALEPMLQDRVKQAALDMKTVFVEHYRSIFEQAVDDHAAELAREAERFAAGMAEALRSAEDLSPYKQRLSVLERLAQQ